MEAFLTRYGLWAVALGAAVERDAVCLMAGILSHVGAFSLLEAMLAAFTGAYVADCLCYFVGRQFSHQIQKWPKVIRSQAKMKFLHRFDYAGILLSQFLYGFRTASMVFWGFRKVSLPRFLIMDGLGCALLVSVVTFVGYLLSSSALALLGKVKRLEIYLISAFIVVILTVWLVSRWVRKRSPELET